MATSEGLIQTNGAEASPEGVWTKFSATQTRLNGGIEHRMNAAHRIRGQTEYLEADSGPYQPSGGGWDLQTGGKVAIT